MGKVQLFVSSFHNVEWVTMFVDDDNKIQQRLRREGRDEENVRPNRDLQIERPIQMDFLTNEPNSERRALPCHLRHKGSFCAACYL